MIQYISIEELHLYIYEKNAVKKDAQYLKKFQKSGVFTNFPLSYPLLAHYAIRKIKGITAIKKP